MLLCLSSFRDLSILYKGLELPPIGQVLKFGPGIQVQSHGNLHFIVLRRIDKREHITKAKQHLMIDDGQILILDRTYEGPLEDGEFLVTSVAELEVFLPLTLRGRNKLALEFFRDTTQHDIALGFQVLTTLVLKRSTPPSTPQLRTHKRICAKECVVCMDEPASVLFNCGHECVCDGCSEEWMKVNQTCPICKERVTDVYTQKI